MRTLLMILGIVSLLACNRDKVDPDNQATALRNGEDWGKIHASVTLYYYDSSLISVVLSKSLSEDKYSTDIENLYFEKFPKSPGVYYLKRSTLTETDSFSSHQRYYLDHVGGAAAYAVRNEGDLNNFLEIESFDPTTGRLEARFQGTYVRCDAKMNVVGGDSIVFTEGKIIATLEQ